MTAPMDAIVKKAKPAICGTNPHILRGDVPSCQRGCVLVHAGVGIIEEAGPAVMAFKPGDVALISCSNACGKCVYCRMLIYSHCVTGGWILGNSIDSPQAEFVRLSYVDMSFCRIPDGEDEDPLAVSSDILPTGLECGVLNGNIQPGCPAAILGCEP